MNIDLVAVIVDDYDPAIDFFVGTLGFELVEDSPAVTNDGRPKRWWWSGRRARAPGVLLARADGDNQSAAVGNQLEHIMQL